MYAVQLCLVMMEKHKIVGVADVVFRLEMMLHPLVELVHVHIDEEL